MRVRTFSIAVLLLLTAAPALAQVTFDAAAHLEFQISDNTTSGSLTVGSGANRYLLVCATSRNSQTVSGVTAQKGIGATAMTKLVELTDSTFGFIYVSLWGLTDPNSGSNAIVATLTGTPSVQSAASAMSFAGVDQTTPASNAASAEGSSQSASSVTVTSAVNNMVADCLNVVGLISNDAAVGAGQTERTDDDDAAGANVGDVLALSTEAGAASVGMTWTWTTAALWIGLGVSLNEAAAADPGIGTPVRTNVVK